MRSNGSQWCIARLGAVSACAGEMLSMEKPFASISSTNPSGKLNLPNALDSEFPGGHNRDHNVWRFRDQLTRCRTQHGMVVQPPLHDMAVEKKPRHRYRSSISADAANMATTSGSDPMASSSVSWVSKRPAHDPGWRTSPLRRRRYDRIAAAYNALRDSPDWRRTCSAASKRSFGIDTAVFME